MWLVFSMLPPAETAVIRIQKGNKDTRITRSRSSIFIINFDEIANTVPVFPLLFWLTFPQKVADAGPRSIFSNLLQLKDTKFTSVLHCSLQHIQYSIKNPLNLVSTGK